MWSNLAAIAALSHDADEKVAETLIEPRDVRQHARMMQRTGTAIHSVAGVCRYWMEVYNQENQTVPAHALYTRITGFDGLCGSLAAAGGSRVRLADSRWTSRRSNRCDARR